MRVPTFIFVITVEKLWSPCCCCVFLCHDGFFCRHSPTSVLLANNSRSTTRTCVAAVRSPFVSVGPLWSSIGSSRLLPFLVLRCRCLLASGACGPPPWSGASACVSYLILCRSTCCLALQVPLWSLALAHLRCPSCSPLLYLLIAQATGPRRCSVPALCLDHVELMRFWLLHCRTL